MQDYLMFMSLTSGQCDFSHSSVQHAFSWSALPDMDTTSPAGKVGLGASASADLVFVLSGEAIEGAHVFASQAVTWPMGPALLRIDEVCFPVGAVAQRHTHSGAGFRHLICGSLQLETVGNTQLMEPGDTWYEPTDTPVKAISRHQVAFTRFVRCMVIPLKYEGKSTFQLVAPADAELPRLQVTHHHLDQAVYVEAG